MINPNNPTGAVYSREILSQMVDLARKHQLLLLADEIYDKILYDDAKHISLATLAPDMLCLTFNGLSKAYRVAGYRAGWLAITGPKEHAGSFIEGISLLANMRLCPNVPAQHAIQVALGGHQSIDDLVLPGGRLLEQRDVAWTKLNEIPGVSCVKPEGALYAFPRLDPEVYDIADDEQLVLDLLLQEKILVTQGTGFNWPAPDHLRIVTLPWARDLAGRDRAAGQLPDQPIDSKQVRAASTVERVTHSHSHNLSSGPSPLGPLPAKIVVGLLVAIGIAVIAGAVLLWPSRQHVDIPMPFQNATGGAVSTQRGHVLSSGLGDCGSPSASQVLTTAPQPGARALGAACRRWSQSIPGRTPAPKPCWSSPPGPANRNSRAGDHIRVVPAGRRPGRHHVRVLRLRARLAAGRAGPGVRGGDCRGGALARAAGAGGHRGRILGAGGVLAAGAARRRARGPGGAGGVGGDPVRGDLSRARCQPAHQRRLAGHLVGVAAGRRIILGGNRTRCT